jgi:hypothetical protein
VFWLENLASILLKTLTESGKFSHAQLLFTLKNPAQEFWGAGEDRSMAPAF